MLDDRGHVVEDHLDLAAQQVGDRRRRAPIRHMLHLDVSHCHEHFAGQMHRGAIARRGHVHLARIGLGIGDEFRDRFRWHGVVDCHHIRHAVERGHRRDVANEIEFEVGVERGVDVIGGVDKQYRVSVRLRIDHRLSRDVIAGAGFVLDHELLAKLFRKPLPDQARQNIGCAARRISHHKPHRPGRIIQRRSAAGRPDQGRKPDC